MKLYAPSYYKKFKCTADKCEHSCCVGWEIDIDAASLSKYKKLKCGYGAAIINSIAKDESTHFKLAEGDRCPHLDEHGLCRIITNLGEDYLCDICREHPRFYNYTSAAELGIGMSCQEAAKIILASPDYATLEEIGEVDADANDAKFDGRRERKKIYEILGDSAFSYAKRLEKIYQEYSIDIKSDSYWLEILESLEYLDESHKSAFMNYSSKHRAHGFDEYSERFLAYFVYRHATEAFSREDFRARLSFCLFCERLFASLIHSEKPKDLDELSVLARIISEEIEYSIDNTFALTY